jgi:hypothetical protein
MTSTGGLSIQDSIHDILSSWSFSWLPPGNFGKLEIGWCLMESRLPSVYGSGISRTKLPSKLTAWVMMIDLLFVCGLMPYNLFHLSYIAP